MAKNFQNVQKGSKQQKLRLQSRKFIFSILQIHHCNSTVKENCSSCQRSIYRSSKSKQNMAETVCNNLSLSDELIKITSTTLKVSAFKTISNCSIKADLKAAEEATDIAEAALKAGDILTASNNMSRFQELITQITEKSAPILQWSNLMKLK